MTPDTAPRSRQRSLPQASTTSWSFAARSTPPRRHGRISTSHQASTSTYAERSKPRCPTHRCSFRDPWSIGVRPTGRSARSVRWRRDDPRPDCRPRSGDKLRSGHAESVRPCIRCNQTCQVRDARNPLVGCVGEPSAGRETEDPDWYEPTTLPRRVVVVGGGVAGLEAARVAAMRGHHVTVVERAPQVGGIVATAGPGAALAAWLESECRRLGVEISTSTLAIPDGDVTIQCTGSQPGRREYDIDDRSVVIDIADVRRGVALPSGPIALFDPIGGPIAVALAEELGERAILITQDHIAGNELSRTGDLAPANVRLAQRGDTSCGGRFCAPCDPARSRWRTGSAASGTASPAQRWSTAGSDFQPIRSLKQICRRAIASHPARSTRPCSRAAELHGPSITSVTNDERSQ